MPYDSQLFTGTFWTVLDGDFYVSTYGNDLSGTGAPNAPYLTLHRAMQDANDGQKIVIGPDEYIHDVGTSSAGGAVAACRVATTGSIALTGGAMTIESVFLTTGDRVLVWQQDDPRENGIYTVPSSGSWPRATDFDSPQNMLAGTMVPILEGDVNGSTFFQFVTPGPIDLLTSDIIFEPANVSDWGQIEGDITLQADLAAQLDEKADKTNVLEKDNTTAYTPTTDHHPATKSYVDGEISGHNHSAGDINSGTLGVERLPIGTNSSSVAAGDHQHDASDINSGIMDISRLPVGNDGSSIAIGNHQHSANDLVSGTVDVSRLPIGTSSGTVAAGDHAHTSSQVGLSNVNNTADSDKPISTAQQAALDLKLNVADVVDDLATTSSSQALSANQGLILKGLIDNINTLLSSDDTTLDELQEVVDFIKQNKADLDTLGISNIAGLQAILDSKSDKNNVLEKDNSTAFTPTADHHPATKAYVDAQGPAISIGSEKQVPFVNATGTDFEYSNDIVLDASNNLIINSGGVYGRGGNDWNNGYTTLGSWGGAGLTLGLIEGNASDIGTISVENVTDSGSSPILSLRAGSSVINNRPLFDLKNHNNQVVEVSAAGAWNFQGNNLKNISDPIDAQDVASKSYVDDSIGNGLGVNGSHTIWGQQGESFILNISEFPTLAALDETSIALISPETGELQKLVFDGKSWSIVGNGLAIGTARSYKLTTLAVNRVAVIDDNTSDLRTYDFDGSNWTLVGNPLSVDGSEDVKISRLSNSSIAHYDAYGGELSTYSFDGTNWSSLGNQLSLITFHRLDSMTSLDLDQVAIYSISDSTLSAYVFDGTNWIQTGNSINTVSTNPLISALGLNSVLLIERYSDDIRIFNFDGSNWSETTTNSAVNLSPSVLTNLNGDTICAFNFDLKVLSTYSLGRSNRFAIWSDDNTLGNTPNIRLTGHDVRIENDLFVEGHVNYLPRTQVVTANKVLEAADNGNIFEINQTSSITLPESSLLRSGWHIQVVNKVTGGGMVTITKNDADPYGIVRHIAGSTDSVIIDQLYAAVMIYWNGKEFTFVGTVKEKYDYNGLLSKSPDGSLNFDTSVDFNRCVRLDDTHVLNTWRGAAQVFEIDPSDGLASALGTPFVFDGSNGAESDCLLLDESHALISWYGPGSFRFQILEINLTNWEVLPDTNNFFQLRSGAFNNIRLRRLSANKVLVAVDEVSAGPTGTNHLEIIEINIAAKSVVFNSLPYELQVDSNRENAIEVLNETRGVVFYKNTQTDEGMAKVLTLDANGDTIGETGSGLVFDINVSSITSLMLNANTVICAWVGGSTPGMKFGLFSIDHDSGEIMALGNSGSLGFTTNEIDLKLIDSSHFIYFTGDIGGEGVGQVVRFNSDTGSFTLMDNDGAGGGSLNYSSVGRYVSIVKLTSDMVAAFWEGPNNNGYGKGFSIS